MSQTTAFWAGLLVTIGIGIAALATVDRLKPYTKGLLMSGGFVVLVGIAIAIAGSLPPQPPPPPPPPDGPVELSPATVRTWCRELQPGGCSTDRFEQLVESNNVVNPYGVHYKTGPPARFEVSDDVYIDVWDCFKSSNRSPHQSTVLPRVCEASFRTRH